MNRIILIGNGFDLAHGLPTRYEDFVKWYWERRLQKLEKNKTIVSSDTLCTFTLERGFYLNGNTMNSWSDIYQYYKKELADKVSATEYFLHLVDESELCVCEISPFFDNVCRSIETKGWVDIENEYYRVLIQCSVENKDIKCTVQALNKQLHYVQTLLVEYLCGLKHVVENKGIRNLIYEPIKVNDISVVNQEKLVAYFQYWLQQNEDTLREKMREYGLDNEAIEDEIDWRRDLMVKIHEAAVFKTLARYNDYFPRIGLFPEKILFLNFNYTENAMQYFIKNRDCFQLNYIHGRLDKPDSIIFGYGDELDEKYDKLLALNDNECLRYMKSFKYLESSNYRDMLLFIESAPYQVYIMGHSCGNSDRTLLNTLFEHRNCVTIKPFYHKKDGKTDDYLNIVQNISRSFTDMKLMRDRVVNKTYCSPLPQNI